MKLTSFVGRLFVPALILAASTEASELVIHLTGNTPVERHKVTVTCDAVAVKMGVPEGTFEVEYINAQPTALAVLPLEGKQLVFASVISGSGARYAAGRFVWWDAGARGISLSAPSASGEERGTCRAVGRK